MVTPLKAGSTTITFNSAAVADKYNASIGKELTITVTAPVVDAPSITAGGYFFDESKTVEITSDYDGASIKYSYDNATWNDYTEALTITETTTVYAKAVKADCTDSEVVSATYTKFVKSDLVSVSAETTWDFSKITETLELNASTTPKNTDDYYTIADIAILNSHTIPATFGDATTIAFKGKYPYRNKKSQAGSWKFNTTVPGTIKVTFSDTGSSGAGLERYLNVNGENTEYYTMRTGSDADSKTTGAIAVSAGDVIITGRNADNGNSDIVVTKIVFTPAKTATVTLNSKGFATYSSKYDFTYEGADAYGMALTATSLKGTKVTSGKIKAGEGILFKGAADAIVNITETTGAEELEGNDLIGTTDADNDVITSDAEYKYALSGDTFVTFTGSMKANKAFFGSATQLNSLDLVFDDEIATAINGIEASEAQAAPVKVIKNGKLYIGNYNVAGQQVK